MAPINDLVAAVFRSALTIRRSASFMSASSLRNRPLSKFCILGGKSCRHYGVFPYQGFGETAKTVPNINLLASSECIRPTRQQRLCAVGFSMNESSCSMTNVNETENQAGRYGAFTPVGGENNTTL